MVWLILILALIIRLISLNQSLWLDEAINVLATKNYSLFGIITEYAKADFHPPGWFIILWLWTKLVGYSEMAVRIPSIIFGLLTVWLTYLIGKKLISKQIGLISALLLSINPLHIYYSQEARMYSMAAFAVSLNFYLFIRFVNEKKINALLFILSNLLVLVSDYVAYLIFPAQLIFLLITKSILFKKWISFLLISLVFGVFWLPMFFIQLNIGWSASTVIPVWRDVVGSFDLKSIFLTYVKFIIGRISHPDLNAYIALFSPVGLLIAFLIFRSIKYSDLFIKKLLLIWLIVPIIFAALISAFIPIYSYFRLLFLLPPFLVLWTLGIWSFKKEVKFIILVLVVFVQIICSALYLANPIFQREDWQGLIKRIAGKGPEVLIESTGPFAPLEYYLQKGYVNDYPIVSAPVIIPALKSLPAKNDSDLVDLGSLLEYTNGVYYLEYLVDVTDPQRLVQNRLNSLGFEEVSIINFNGLGFLYEYHKK